MFEGAIFYDAANTVNFIHGATILENMVMLSSFLSAEVFDDVETEMHTLTQNKERCFEASKASFIYNGRLV